MKRTDISVVGLALLTAFAGGCGTDARSNQADTSRVDASQVTPSITPVGGPLTTTPGRTRVQPRVSERTIKAKQAEREGAPVKVKQERAVVRERHVTAGKETAPAGALNLARNAARAWVLYRIEGEKPAASVVPKDVRGTIPPMAPDLRSQGAARIGALTIFDAHPEKREWVAVVAIDDRRIPQVAVTVARHHGHFEVTAINEGGA